MAKKITIRQALIAITALSLLTLTFTSILLGHSTFTKVSENSMESDLLPNQLAKVEARIMHQLSTGR
ncbi:MULTISPECIES: hypothetical protein [unclassified Pseudoalteromonas]|uniref:hypothetical protein n=1 Tax=unclassified Pseudoalteromonas TaxID=194690 RepID=UPI0005A7DC98|nr:MULTISPECIES: hypothetical protein [unclassified Pseudoalteromonas]